MPDDADPLIADILGGPTSDQAGRALLLDILGDPDVRPIEKPIGVEGGKYTRTATRHSYKSLLMAKRAQAQLERLPDPGESYHLVVAGSYRSWDLVPAILALAARPAVALWIATLSYNRENLQDLLRLSDAGQLGRVHFIVSVYDKANDPGRFEYARTELGARGHRLLAMQNHCKIIALDLGGPDGQIVSESSANLRSHSTTEQVTLTRDPGLYAFHTAWMEEAFAR
jgi:hypothetical protein